MFYVLIFRVVCSGFENGVRFWIFVRFYRGDIIWPHKAFYKKDGLGHLFIYDFILPLLFEIPSYSYTFLE